MKKLFLTAALIFAGSVASGQTLAQGSPFCTSRADLEMAIDAANRDDARMLQYLLDNRVCGFLRQDFEYSEIERGLGILKARVWLQDGDFVDIWVPVTAIGTAG